MKSYCLTFILFISASLFAGNESENKLAGNARKYPGIASFANAETLYSVENAISGTDTKRCKVVREQNFKYPLIRIDETVSLKGNAAAGVNAAVGEDIVSRTEMVADHMIVKLKKGADRESPRIFFVGKHLRFRRQIKGAKDVS